MKPPKFTIPAGTSVAICEVKGDKLNPEPEELRIRFPGGELSLVRCEDGAYWAHILRTDKAAADGLDDAVLGRLTDARVDVRSKHASETDAGDFAHPETYHVAIKIERDEA